MVMCVMSVIISKSGDSRLTTQIHTIYVLLSHYRSDNSAINELLATSIGKDLTVELNTSVYRNCLEHILTNYKVGRYAAHVTEEKVC